MGRQKLTRIKFTVGSLVSGRIVKTKTFTKSLLADFQSCGLQHSVEDIKDACSKSLRVNGYKGDVVLLGYPNCPPHIKWPVTGLSQSFGIKL